MTPYEIPLSPQAQTFLVTLVGVQYRFTVQYRDAPNGGWTLDIATGAGAVLVAGIPLVTGANLLAQYAYLNIGVPLYVATDGDLTAVPTFQNLGQESHLYFTATP
jgi:hypothetical protein